MKRERGGGRRGEGGTRAATAGADAGGRLWEGQSRCVPRSLSSPLSFIRLDARGTGCGKTHIQTHIQTHAYTQWEDAAWAANVLRCLHWAPPTYSSLPPSFVSSILLHRHRSATCALSVVCVHLVLGRVSTALASTSLFFALSTRAPRTDGVRTFFSLRFSLLLPFVWARSANQAVVGKGNGVIR